MAKKYIVELNSWCYRQVRELAEKKPNGEPAKGTESPEVPAAPALVRCMHVRRFRFEYP